MVKADDEHTALLSTPDSESQTPPAAVRSSDNNRSQRAHVLQSLVAALALTAAGTAVVMMRQDQGVGQGSAVTSLSTPGWSKPVVDSGDRDHHDGYKVTGDSLSVMKRTHLSLNAVKEGIWLQTKIGLGVTGFEYFYNSTGNAVLHGAHMAEDWTEEQEEAVESVWGGNKQICSARSLFTWQNQNNTNTYDWHEFQSSTSPAGEMGPDYWWDLIYKYNTQLDVSTMSHSPPPFVEHDSSDWNVFMHMGTHFYVHDLTMHMVELQKDNTPFLARRYTSVADENPRRMFVVVVPNPYNGNCIIIHSGSVADPKQEALFLPLEDAACTYAVALPYSYEKLEAWAEKVYVQTTNNASLPKPFPVVDSIPTFDMEEVENYFKNDIRLHEWAHVKMNKYNNNVTIGHEGGSLYNDVPEEECQVFEIDLSSQFNTNYQTRFVYTPEARLHSELGRFHRYVDKTVRDNVNFNEGYCRWMDDHLGISLPAHTSGKTNAVTSLDEIRENLEKAHVPYHAHFTEYNNGTREGSIWAWGVSGIGIEWHGALTLESFGAMNNALGNFDFCQADSTCTAADEMCVMDSTVSGATRR